MTADIALPARRGGAKALLLTILGEFVLPGVGAAWTSSLVDACDVLGIGEKNARQAIARVADEAMMEPTRHGRLVRWQLTPSGRRLLESGADRIYRFGTESVEWSGEWLLAHCPIPESHRTLRHQLRTRLAFVGFGELAASLAVSPHVDREPTLRGILADLGLLDDSVVLRSRTGSLAGDADLVARAWDLETLAAEYAAFSAAHGAVRPHTSAEHFRATVELVHDWRRFPFVDPELPTELLPAGWAGTTASGLFHDRRASWSAAAVAWFAELEARHDVVS